MIGLNETPDTLTPYPSPASGRGERRASIADLQRRCQKLDHRRLGNWMARHVTRPAALRITWLVAPWGISANTATLAAWLCGAAAAAALAWGTVAGWLIGAALLQLWYLLDHVDGQLARFHGTASLDGTQLDYLMHHTVNLLVPLGIGCGLAARSLEPLWALGGLVWGMALLLVTLQHDARYKAFVQRLKCVRGDLRAVGGGGGRPTPQPPIPRSLHRLAAWTARKSCEIHVVANLAAVVASVQWLAGDVSLCTGRVWLALAAPTAAIVAGWTICHSQHQHAAEAEFAAWYRPPQGHDLTYADGWWDVQQAPPQNEQTPRQNKLSDFPL